MYISLHQLWRQHYITIKTNFTLHQKHNLLYKLNRNCQYSTTVDGSNRLLHYLLYRLKCRTLCLIRFLQEEKWLVVLSRTQQRSLTYELTGQKPEAGLKYLNGIFILLKSPWSQNSCESVLLSHVLIWVSPALSLCFCGRGFTDYCTKTPFFTVLGETGSYFLPQLWTVSLTCC